MKLLVKSVTSLPYPEITGDPEKDHELINAENREEINHVLEDVLCVIPTLRGAALRVHVGTLPVVVGASMRRMRLRGKPMFPELENVIPRKSSLDCA